MADEFKLLKQRSHGQKAARSWEDEVWQEAFAAVEKHIIEQWRNSVGGEDKEREQAYYLHRAVEAVKQMVKSYIYTGQIASKQLLEIEETKRGGRNPAG
jgi:hypothetical protein